MALVFMSGSVTFIIYREKKSTRRRYHLCYNTFGPETIVAIGRTLYCCGLQYEGSLTACLERHFPGFAAQVEVTDVAMPLITERFAGSFMAYQAWPVPGQKMLEALADKDSSKTLPGLSNFHMVGQWAGGLGLPNVAAMGRRVIAALCKQDGRRFVTTEV